MGLSVHLSPSDFTFPRKRQDSIAFVFVHLELLSVFLGGRIRHAAEGEPSGQFAESDPEDCFGWDLN